MESNQNPLQSVDFLSVKEFAILIRVHPNTVRRGIKSGRINAFKVGLGAKAIYRIPKVEINRMALIDLEKIINDLIDKKNKVEIN